MEQTKGDKNKPGAPSRGEHEVDEIADMTRVLLLAPESHPDRPVYLGYLGRMHRIRFQRLGKSEDLQKAHEYITSAMPVLGTGGIPSGGHPDFPWIAYELAIVYELRYLRQGDLADLGKAIELFSQAILLTPNPHPALPQRLDDLGIAHDLQFQRLGELDDLEKAIKYKSRAVSLLSSDNPDLATRLESLGTSYAIRFQHLGNLDDGEKAVLYRTRVLSIASENDPNLPRYLENLGVSHRARFHRLGEIEDIEKAIEYQTLSLSLTPEDHPDLPRKLENLGRAHDTRFGRLEAQVDSDKALEYKTRALLLIPGDHPDLAKHLENLSLSHLGRVGSLSKFDELDKAIEYMARAVSLTPEDHVDMSQRVTNLGLIYKSRFEHLKELDDLDQAIKYLSRAVLLRPEGHPNQSENLGALGRAYATQFQESREIKHLHDSLDCFRKAAQYVAGRPSIRFDCARQWAKLAAQHDIPESLEAYQVAIDLIPGLVWLGSTTNQRYERARELSNLAVEAASVAIGINNCALALEWLENARCVIWSQLLLLRYPLDQLRSSQPGLADRIGKVSGALYSAGSGTSLPSDTLEKERVDQQHRRLAVEFDQLISNARMIPGFENFLKPKRASELAHAARKGPVVVINCHEMRSDALIIIPGQTEIAHIPLPQSTYKGAQRSRVQMEASLKSTGIRERGFKNVPSAQRIGGFEDLLSTLWVDIAKPVLDFLGYTPKPNTEEMPHITWCPTSVLSFLPIHAAGKYNQPHSKVSDFAVSSYTPTLTALLSPLHSSTTRPRILVVGQEATPGHNQLPGITKELACIENHARNVAELSQITSSDATAPAVLDAMEQHDWVHLACHAHQNAANPTKSGFFLHESSLDLDSITRRLFTQKGLAFLSACQTATGDETLPDEAVHLASGMLMAGYSSVIATMWSVLDEDAPFITDKVYGQLMKDGRVGNGEGAKALHNAAAELRAKVGDKAFGRWVPYIHMGS
ncbi:N-(5-amino-5-carboxypentanoyl)-L-cysteinyl-D-valine synthase [Rhizoctonia solani]|uniref:N-(5-amino-5-carboxypentanoyl)-L-cysteinyl-D-valine synthase n=1 Tax=Rhizoctonia solani TaxID=456999 RepID=A0A0K6G0H7_9AGAM|nr:N-(5-amino-5-carboxypentanoyl)-L-cysteinyl-D-valine synthase [Rhizoctonia solani]